ncbi:unnamed protein product [Dovyalis caffra]|uniref:Uncharacterized protein n=1 Tax=Dovyalis caffra TaxID=77055 RepID=A0AAV1RT28_9ROSI|nr:unnamed protein product [Dovyalis caffra]
MKIKEDRVQAWDWFRGGRVSNVNKVQDASSEWRKLYESLGRTRAGTKHSSV